MCGVGEMRGLGEMLAAVVIAIKKLMIVRNFINSNLV